MSLLDVRDLTVTYRAGNMSVQALSEVSFSLGAGEALGVVGESGCGKSTLAKAILALLPRNARVTGGAVVLDGTELFKANAEQLRQLRWTEMAYVTQSAMDSLNPVARILDQFAETGRAHGEKDVTARAEALMRDVGLDARWLKSFPHELSGGMRQRVIIALSLLFEPPLLIADEPTTGLDVIVQRQVLDLLRRIRIQHGTGVIFISHDIAVIAELCSSVAVMYGGRIVEKGSTVDVLEEPLHPYTIGLKQAFPDMRDSRRALINIPGAPPALDRPIDACLFAARCPFAQDRCRNEAPPLRPIAGRQVACHFAEQAAEFRVRAANPATWARPE
ncbi:ABC transporter ATP-binding protein [Bradyrhizobium sp. NP1]|uniref:ABC transporter ATP-binding protein n=1 Tax=Bradyrhizobium sp. NP1 TaxID=3049772 RepID=UPI0025A5F9E9|nr:ABC transporter ATP-binding protein [Bradyrhizobium sp. NP1]WJR80018.1 ABC transporter ATP-binding protein [Bradyrhizobium sp. NP1]